MFKRFFKSVRVTYKKTVTSIAFLPAIIAICFLLLSFVIIQFDFSDTGKAIKSNLHWLSLKDASTARTICSAIAGGIISLTVFSFSMVMILLNQAASQMSNRILDKVIGNRFQQMVLGFYIGTIVYALFLLSTIRDINSGIYVPAISVYLLITLTIVDIFLFIYFLHYVTQTVKYETIIERVYDDTKHAMEKSCCLKNEPSKPKLNFEGKVANSFKSGLLQGFDKNALINLCEREKVTIHFIHSIGTYLTHNTPFLLVDSDGELSKDFLDNLKILINIDKGKEINTSYYYGYTQLMEIAIKALSPGINDPGTAVISLQAIGDLLVIRLNNFPETHFYDENKKLRIVTTEKTFEQLFNETILPIWDYGKKDRMVIYEMHSILTQLKLQGNETCINRLLIQVTMQMQQYEQSY